MADWDVTISEIDIGMTSVFPGPMRVCRTSDVPTEGGLQVIIAPSKVLAVFRVGEEYFVTDDECTHGNASLSEGELDGDDIICPYHLGAFCLRTGEPTVSPCSIPLRTYPVEMRGDVIFALLD